MNIRKNVWCYKYTPERFEDVILSEEIRPKLKKALDEVPNMLLYGHAGTGKGSFTNVLIKQKNLDYMWINASSETGIDVVRNKIAPFATSLCMKDMKVVVLNEADSLTSGLQGSQKLLRQLIEDTYKICRFIFICNYENNIIPELKSRTQVIKFENPPKKEIGKLLLKILRDEKIKFDNKDIIEIIKKTFPDIRKAINVLQENSIDGVLTGSRIFASEVLYEKILKLMLEKNIEGVRKELRSNYISYDELYYFLYDNAGEFKEPGGAILMIGDALRWDATISIKEVNFMKMFVDFIYQKVI